MYGTSCFAADVMLGHNRTGKGDANRAYTLSDSPGAATAAKSQCLRLPCYH